MIEPGPVVLLTTAHAGRRNVMTMSWHMMVEFEPPLVACVVSDANYSFTALRETKECVIALPAARLARAVVAVGNCSGRRVRRLVSRAESPAGWHDLMVDGRGDGGSSLSAGIYFYRIVSVDGVATGRLVLLK